MVSEPIDSENEPWRAITKTRDNELLHKEIARLPIRYRNVIVLCHLEGKSRAEAASILDCTTASVKASLARGRKLLRQRLIRHGIAASSVIGAINFAAIKSADASIAGISDALIQSTMQYCQGLSPDLGVGSGSNIQSLANKGLTEMTLGITQTSIAAAAGVMAICGLSLAAWAGQQEVAKNNVNVIYVDSASSHLTTYRPAMQVQDNEPLQNLQNQSQPVPLPNPTAKTADETWAAYVQRLVAAGHITQQQSAQWTAGNTVVVSKSVEQTIVQPQTRTRTIPVTRTRTWVNEAGQEVSEPYVENVDQTYTVMVPYEENVEVTLNIPAPGTKPQNATNPGFQSDNPGPPLSLPGATPLHASTPAGIVQDVGKVQMDEVASKKANESWFAYVNRLHDSEFITDSQLKDWRNGKEIEFLSTAKVNRIRHETRTRAVPVTRMISHENENGEIVSVPTTEVVTQNYTVAVPYIDEIPQRLTIPARGSQPESATFPAPPKEELKLKLMSVKPKQTDARYDSPNAKQISSLRLKEMDDGSRGFQVENESGTIYRQFVDLNGDNKTDNWIFFQDGKESYREVDLDFDGKVELYQYTIGKRIRYGIDEDQDGTIDAWEEDR